MNFCPIVLILLLKSSVGHGHWSWIGLGGGGGHYSTQFCDNSTRNESLIDSVFNFEDTYYAFRKPNTIWILKFDEMSGNWSQIGDSIKLDNLLKDYKRNGFDSIFTIDDFVKCDHKTDPRCPYRSPDFDASNITFIFFKNTFFIYQRIHELLYEPIDWNAKNRIPWEANTQTNSIKEFFGINGRIDSAVYTLAGGKDAPNRKAVLFSNTSVKEFELTDKQKQYKEYRIKNSPALNGGGNGGLRTPDGDLVFIVNNKLYKYEIEDDSEINIELKDMLLTTWDYFNCDSMPIRPTEVTTTQGFTNETTIVANSTAISETTMTTGDESSLSTESTNTTTDDFPDSPHIPDPGNIDITDDDQEFRRQLLFVLQLLFAVICFCVAFVTLFSYMNFKILT